MKILQIISSFKPSRAGDSNICANLSQVLVERGHKVTIITTNFNFDTKYAETMDDVEIIPFKCIANLGLFLYTPEINVWLKNNMKYYDVVHLHNVRSYQNIIVHKYAKKYRLPYVLQGHGTILRIIEKKILKQLYDIVFGHKIIKNAHKYVAVSNIEKGQYLQMRIDSSKISLIPNALKIDDFNDLPEKGLFRKKIGVKNETKLILYLGRIHKIKGIDFLIKSFSILCNELEDVVLVIAGPDDGYLRDLEKLAIKTSATDKIKFVGYTEKKMGCVDADVLVYPSIHEIFGLVPFEAIMCGTPIIVSEGSGCGELVKEAKCGSLVKYGDINDLNKKIKYIFENPNETENMVMAGKKYIMKNLTWEQNVDKFESDYMDCIEQINRDV